MVHNTDIVFLLMIASDCMAAVRCCLLWTCRNMSRHAQKSPVTVWHDLIPFHQAFYVVCTFECWMILAVQNTYDEDSNSLDQCFPV
jgi:hypothetical protein